MPNWALWLICILLVVWRSLIAAADAALHGTSNLAAKELADQHPWRGGRVYRHKTERESTAATIRMATSLSGFAAAAVAAVLALQLWKPDLAAGETFRLVFPPLLGALSLAVLSATMDVSFRAMAAAAPETWALFTAGIVSFLKLFLYPPLRVVVWGLNFFLKPFRGRVRFETPPPPLEELEKLLAAQAAKDKLDEAAPQLIRSIFEFSDKRCRDVMVPRTEVVSVDVSTSPTQIVQRLGEENHSRLPVYDDDMDQIVGILYARDLIPLLQTPEKIVLKDIVRRPHFVPWVKPIGDLLREMQSQRIHMAVVVDEYGGFMGIVTLEDILREIVGDIGDEFEEEEKPVERLPDGSAIAFASLEREDFEEAFGKALPKGDFETLGGFLSSLAGSIPDVGDRLAWDGFTFVVGQKVGPRLQRIRILRNRPATLPPRSTADSEPSQA